MKYPKHLAPQSDETRVNEMTARTLPDTQRAFEEALSGRRRA